MIAQSSSTQPKVFHQQILKYVNERKEFYLSLLNYIENSDLNEAEFSNLIDIIDQQNFVENREEFEHFLHLLANIFNDHHRDENFFEKFFKEIFKHYSVQIKQTFSNNDIFNIFKSNKLILLYLFKNEIITIDENISISIIDINDYSHFFYPELEKCLGEEKVKDIKNELLSKDPNIFDNFDKKRFKGENDSYICSLIREDSVVDFVSYVNRSKISLSSIIKPSIFETNPFLIKNNSSALDNELDSFENKGISIIEYAAFFGSIQVFQYLRMNKVIMKPSLWLYAIHSKNAELIHLLEYDEVYPSNFDACFIESIKCHHNDIADYIDNNLFPPNYKRNKYHLSDILLYHNYAYFPSDFNVDDEEFYNLRFCNYISLFNLVFGSKENELEKITKQENYNLIKATEKGKNMIVYYLLLQQKEINSYCFFRNYNLGRIIIPSSITSIGNNAFSGCSSLTQIIIPSSITSIGQSSFNGCSLLKKIIIPSSVVSIGKNAFCRCKSLSEITIQSSITTIESFCFLGCSSLKQILIPSSVTSIGNDAFNGCSSLLKVTIPSSVTSIGKNAFNECSSLKEIIIPSSVTLIESFCFHRCSSLKNVTIPSSITSIGNNAFDGCQSLSGIIIPSSVKSIGKNAFNGCKLLK